MKEDVLVASFDLAKRLSPDRLKALAVSIESRRSVSRLVSSIGSAEGKASLRRFLSVVAENDLDPYLASAILLSAGHSCNATRNEQKVKVVFTGPRTEFVASRNSDQVLIDLIRSAEKELFIVSFVATNWNVVLKTLIHADERGVRIKALFESSKEHGGTLDWDHTKKLAEAIPRAKIYHWLDRTGEFEGGKVHAKIFLADGRDVFIGSTNLTDHALNKNLEAGVLIKGGDAPRDIHRHLRGLIDTAKIAPLT